MFYESSYSYTDTRSMLRFSRTILTRDDGNSRNYENNIAESVINRAVGNAVCIHHLVVRKLIFDEF